MQLPLAYLPAHRRVELPGTSLSSSPVDRVRSLLGLAPPTMTYTAIRPAGASPAQATDRHHGSPVADDTIRTVRDAAGSGGCLADKRRWRTSRDLSSVPERLVL
jgi:hypothetical protein